MIVGIIVCVVVLLFVTFGAIGYFMGDPPDFHYKPSSATRSTPMRKKATKSAGYSGGVPSTGSSDLGSSIPSGADMFMTHAILGTFDSPNDHGSTHLPENDYPSHSSDIGSIDSSSWGDSGGFDCGGGGD